MGGPGRIVQIDESLMGGGERPTKAAICWATPGISSSEKRMQKMRVCSQFGTTATESQVPGCLAFAPRMRQELSMLDFSSWKGAMQHSHSNHQE